MVSIPQSKQTTVTVIPNTCIITVIFRLCFTRLHFGGSEEFVRQHPSFVRQQAFDGDCQQEGRVGRDSDRGEENHHDLLRD